MGKKKSTKPKNRIEAGPGFSYSRENDEYVDELMKLAKTHSFYPKYVYDLACLSCVYALNKNLKPAEFTPKKKDTHKINAEQLANRDVDFILKIIGYFFSKDYKILDKIKEYRKICEKLSNTGMTLLHKDMMVEDYPNITLQHLIIQENGSSEEE